jgi:hypothetical protein
MGLLLILVGLVALTVGVVAFFRPLPRVHISTRRVAGVLAAAGLAFVLFGGVIAVHRYRVQHPATTSDTTTASASATPSTPVRTRRFHPIRTIGHAIAHLIPN